MYSPASPRPAFPTAFTLSERARSPLLTFISDDAIIFVTKINLTARVFWAKILRQHRP
ncbi:hypothetical protein V0288_22320 [Pannus brasiliensis CCIBt3594]|uniref:Uncharacterized protein n=1 Tax=Pannus brasiliensis CCIBt3594 TaxID=1427578 RepID=A0AAW9QX88_9CHRO